jgi:hypothetical protein
LGKKVFNEVDREEWPFAAAVLLVTVFTGMVAPLVDWEKVAKAIDELRIHRAGTVQPGPTVLLVSMDESDRFNVRATVEPRGYTLLLADSAKSGMELLTRDRDRMAIVLIDVALPQSQRLAKACRAQCPRAHLIQLHRPRRIGQVSAMLINKAVE